jgi:hypothetical protein
MLIKLAMLWPGIETKYEAGLAVKMRPGFESGCGDWVFWLSRLMLGFNFK